MIDNVVRFYSGYLQVHQKDYWENKTINNIFTPTDSLISAIKGVDLVKTMAPRLESFALASSEKITRGSAVIGIDPASEDDVTNISKWITAGHYLQPGDDGVLLGTDLAHYLGINLGDTLVLLGQGYHGISAAGKYPVRGILKFPMPELNRQTVYMDLGHCQQLFGTGPQLTSLVLMVEDERHLQPAVDRLEAKIHSPYSLMTWSQMEPEILNMIKADRSGGYIMKAILYMLVAFGIFGTILMMLTERHKEMGVMVAIGMQKYRLAFMLFFETIFIGAIGVLAGFAGSVPLIGYFYQHPLHYTGDAAKTMVEMGFEPLLYFSWTPAVFYVQAVAVFVITLLIAIYPIVKAQSLKVSEALRS